MQVEMSPDEVQDAFCTDVEFGLQLANDSEMITS